MIAVIAVIGKYMVWRVVCDVPPFKSGPFSNLDLPSNSGLQEPPLSASQYWCAESLNPSSIDNPPIWLSLLFIFFPNPQLLARLSRQYRPYEIKDKNKNKLMWESYLFIFERLKYNINPSHPAHFRKLY